MIAAFIVAQVLAVTNVDVLTMEDGPHYRRRQTVVIERGSITAVGPSGSTPVPASARRIDGTGAVLMPGLADMHVHLEGKPEEWIGRFLEHGVTTVLNLRGNPGHLALRERVRRGEIVGPTIYTSGPYVNRPAVESEDDAVRAAREQKAAGYDVIKVHGPIGNMAYRALMDSARLPVVGHAPRNMAFDMAFDTVLVRRQQMVAHAEELVYTRFSALDTSGIGDIPRRMAAAGTWLVPTLSTFHGIVAQWGRPAAADSALAVPDAAFMTEDFRAYWLQQNPYTGRTADGAAWAERAYRFQLVLVRALHGAGVRLMTGTDTPVPIMIPGASIHLELAELVAAGLSPYDALTAATRNPGDFIAQLVDSTVKTGRVAPGYRADVLLVRGDPLRRLDALRRPAMVIARGRVVVSG